MVILKIGTGFFKGCVVFFISLRDIIYLFGVNNVFAYQLCFFVIFNNLNVQCIGSYFKFYVVVAGVFELYLAVYILIVVPLVYARHVLGYFNLYQCVRVVQVIADQIVHLFISNINLVLLQQQVTACIKQVDT